MLLSSCPIANILIRTESIIIPFQKNIYNSNVHILITTKTESNLVIFSFLMFLFLKYDYIHTY